MKLIILVLILGILSIFYAKIKYQNPEPFTLQRKPLRIGFGSVWGGFNPSYNIFTLLCKEYGKSLKSGPRDVLGIPISQLEEGKEDIDLYISCEMDKNDRFSKLRKGIPVLHFAGEPGYPEVPGATLQLGFDYNDSDSYMRFPLWMMYINWFQANIQMLGNPKPMPLERLTKINPEELQSKTKFCIFIVSNGGSEHRNTAYDWISEYKHIDSAGKYKNNMGDVLPPGSGGAEDAKFELMKSYKFNLCYENTIQPGYVTEKILQAKAAGCIPIYRGDPLIEKEFDIRGILDARNANTKEKLIALVKDIDTNQMKWIQKFQTPLISQSKKEDCRELLANLAKRLWGFVLEGSEFESCPKRIGVS